MMPTREGTTRAKEEPQSGKEEAPAGQTPLDAKLIFELLERGGSGLGAASGCGEEEEEEDELEIVADDDDDDQEEERREEGGGPEEGGGAAAQAPEGHHHDHEGCPGCASKGAQLETALEAAAASSLEAARLRGRESALSGCSDEELYFIAKTLESAVLRVAHGEWIRSEGASLHATAPSSPLVFPCCLYFRQCLLFPFPLPLPSPLLLLPSPISPPPLNCLWLPPLPPSPMPPSPCPLLCFAPPPPPPPR